MAQKLLTRRQRRLLNKLIHVHLGKYTPAVWRLLRLAKDGNATTEQVRDAVAKFKLPLSVAELGALDRGLAVIKSARNFGGGHGW